MPYSYMTLTCIKEDSSKININLLIYAFENPPSLVLDCNNASNPHFLFPYIALEKLDSVYIIEIELIYKLRDTLKVTRNIVKQLEIKTIVITPFNKLFNYNNEKENYQVLLHSWELIRNLSFNYDVVVGIKDKFNEKIASRFCKNFS